MSVSSSSSSSGRGGPKKARKKRSNISGDILQCLEKFYESQPHPDGEERRQLALELGETENFVRIWFQNRRAKRKRVRNQLLLQEMPPSGENESQNTDDPKKGKTKSPSTTKNTSCDFLHGKKKNSSSSILFPSSSSSSASSTSSSCHQSQFPSSEKHMHSSQVLKIFAEVYNRTLPSKPSMSDEIPLMLDVHLYPQILTRIIGMVAAGESVLKESDADFYESITDADYGILLKDNKKLLYNKVYGLHVADCCL